MLYNYTHTATVGIKGLIVRPNWSAFWRFCLIKNCKTNWT